MGRGKTRQNITAICEASPNGSWLVVCRASVKGNWAREILAVRPDEAIALVGR
jgi:SNF2 family DNA or RNA helicase